MSAAVAIELLRHGDTGQRGFRGQLDDPLSELGWRQLRDAVAGRRWDAIVSSPLARCAAFARWKAEADDVPLRLDPRLMEYHFGDWQAMSMEVLAASQADALGRFWSDPVKYPPPGGETIPAFHARLAEALDAIAAEYAAGDVLVVTHGGAIRALRCHAEGRTLSDMAALEAPHASLHRLTWPSTAGNDA